MRILFVAAECAPFAKVGGLADVAGALPIELAKLGHEVRVLLPRYRMIETDPRWTLETELPGFEVRMNSTWTKESSLSYLDHRGVRFNFVGTDDWFPYATDSEHLYQPGGDPHLFLCRSAISACEALGWIPDIVHGNDWHTGFLPVLLKEQAGPQWSDTATIFTIHNLAYQGEFGLEALDTLGLPHSIFSPEGVEAWGRVNFLKAGAMYADRTNTVSRTYAKEILTPEFGCTLDGVMLHLNRQGRLSGILNGIDTEVFDPLTDRALPATFTAADRRGKQICRAKMAAEVGLTGDGPIASVVSRLSSQKGLDLILEAAPALLDLPIQLVVLGVGDPFLASGLRDLQRSRPGQVAFIEKFDADLAQRIYAGSDLFLMPSSFEPCGLGQLIAMRYGTIPVVRRTGGLADTVHEGINGFEMVDRSPIELIAAVARAVRTYRTPESWSALVDRAMAEDHGWASRATEYESLYTSALNSKRAATV